MQPSEIALIFDHLYWVRDRILDAASAPGVTWPGTAPDGLLDLRATLVHELEHTGGRYGLQTMCEGGGMANATIIERLN